jgi:hypothetical protein
MIKSPLGEPSNKFKVSKLRPKAFFCNYTTLLKPSKFMKIAFKYCKYSMVKLNQDFLIQICTYKNNDKNPKIHSN